MNENSHSSARTWKRCLVAVVLVHLLAFVWLLWTGDVPKDAAARKPVVMKTVTLAVPKPPTPQVASKPAPKPVKKTAPKAKPKPKPEKKVTQKKKETKPKKTEAKPKPVQDNSKRREALAEAQRSLAKLSDKKTTTPSSTHTPVASLRVDALAVDSVSETKTSPEQRYVDALIKRIHQQIKLPENGNVHVELQLDRSGKIISVKVTDAKNVVNKHHVEEALPKAHFSPLGVAYKGQAQHTFALVLNADSE